MIYSYVLTVALGITLLAINECFLLWRNPNTNNTSPSTSTSERRRLSWSNTAGKSFSLHVPGVVPLAVKETEKDEEEERTFPSLAPRPLPQVGEGSTPLTKSGYQVFLAAAAAGGRPGMGSRRKTSDSLVKEVGVEVTEEVRVEFA